MNYQSIELFAGAGGLALGLEKAGFNNVLLNEKDKNACATIRLNRPNWNLVEGDIKGVVFSNYKNIDLVSGGFPCQSFSYAGCKKGFEDVRGTLFFEFARAIDEIKPKMFLGENVRGLISHDKGRTISTIKKVINELGYTLIDPRVLNANHYGVPQKRERIFLIGIRNDLANEVRFDWPLKSEDTLVLKDALKAGKLYSTDVLLSDGKIYSKSKYEVMSLVPPGGYWRDLPEDIQRKYMKKSYFLSGGKTGMARRLSWDEPCLTLTCSPEQNQTERCHPDETRPLSIREYARIQTFPDNWEFVGSMNSKYRQIGNAVPVNLAYSMGVSIIRSLSK